MTQDQKTPKPPVASAPTAAARRFLAQLTEYCFREGWRTPDDFVKHFPADTIMAALKSAPDLRVAILAAATGIYEEILRRKTPALAAEDLRLALEEGTTSSMQLLEVFSPEDRVRYLDPRRIWDFLAEDQFWRIDAEASDEQRQGAAQRMAHTLTLAVQERLLSLRDILDGLTYEAVADSLSPEELRRVVRHALIKGRDGIGLNEKVLLEVLPLDKLVRSIPLEHIWHEVVIRRLAVPAALTDLPREERRASQSERPPSEPRRSGRPSAPPPLPPELMRSPRAASESPRSSPPQLPAYASAEAASPSSDGRRGQHEYAIGSTDYTEEDDELTTAVPPAVSMRDGSLLPPPLRSSAPPSSPSSARGGMTDDFNHPLQSQPLQQSLQQSPSPSSRQLNGQLPFDAQDPDAAERQRQRVTEHLRAIGRLPPRHATMPAGVLRSIDAMYALLPSATDDIQRKSVMRQAFANDNHLRVALLGLIELMDSSIDTSDPVIQEAKIEALIKILLFEEQRRKENGRFPSAPFNTQRSSSLPSGGAAPSSAPGTYGNRGGEGYYFPEPIAASGGYGSGAPHVATQRPPPPVLGNVQAYSSSATPYPGSVPPLPNLPAEPLSSPRRLTMPPPLPPSYPRG